MLDTAPLDPTQRLEVEAYIALIDAKLATGREMLPGRTAERLLQRLCDHRGALLCGDGTGHGFRLSLLGIPATATGGAQALLRNWQNAALARLAASA